MAKKSSKHQSKSANTVTTDPAIIEEPAPTEITAPATKQLPFFDFITLATTEDIKNFSSSRIQHWRAKTSKTYGDAHTEKDMKKGEKSHY